MLGADDDERAGVRQNWHDFDASACECFNLDDKERILAVIKSYPGCIPGFNAHVRILLATLSDRFPHKHTHTHKHTHNTHTHTNTHKHTQTHTHTHTHKQTAQHTTHTHKHTTHNTYHTYHTNTHTQTHTHGSASTSTIGPFGSSTNAPQRQGS